MSTHPANAKPKPTYFRLMEGPWENCLVPCIVRNNPDGGDPPIIATFARINDLDGLRMLVELANQALGSQEIGEAE